MSQASVAPRRLSLLGRVSSSSEHDASRMLGLRNEKSSGSEISVSTSVKKEGSPRSETSASARGIETSKSKGFNGWSSSELRSSRELDRAIIVEWERTEPHDRSRSKECIGKGRKTNSVFQSINCQLNPRNDDDVGSLREFSSSNKNHAPVANVQESLNKPVPRLSEVARIALVRLCSSRILKGSSEIPSVI